MDAAVAAAMSDPERNPNFRRRWADQAVTPIAVGAPRAAIGSFGLVLLEALEQRRRSASKEVSTATGAEHPR